MRFLDGIDRDEIAGLLQRDEYFWLDLTDPSADEVAALGEAFSFHPLALEDLSKRGQRPKLDDFGDFMFLVYYGVGEGSDSEIELEEVHAFLSGGYLVTSHKRGCAATGGSPGAARRAVAALQAVRHLPGAGRPHRLILSGPRAARRAHGSP